MLKRENREKITPSELEKALEVLPRANYAWVIANYTNSDQQASRLIEETKLLVPLRFN